MNTFLRVLRCTSAALLALLSVSLATGCRLSSTAKKPLKILVLGGTGFLGPATIDAALARGHDITMFNRGKTRPQLYPQVKKLHGDRDPDKDEGLKSLENGEWDVVIDNSGYYPRHVKASAELLSPRTNHYIYISSVSAYAEPNPINGDEDSPLATMEDPTVETMGEKGENFGPLKALCEQAAEAAMPGRTTIIRPGYIVGPDDPTGRFTYWPIKFDKSGEILVPGNHDDPIQVIDVRDLGAWLVKLAENSTMGVFTATGPKTPLMWDEVINACIKASTADPKPTAKWVDADTVHNALGFGAYPIWIAPVGDYSGFHTWDNHKAVKAGLKFRPILNTVKDTLAWYKGQEKIENGRTRLAGPTFESEAVLLEAMKLEGARD
jgi:2'-hydroxyisoflavone reductase